MKYNQGYIPKIQYWLDKMVSASTPLEQAQCFSKINYFKKRHQEVYGKVVSVEDLYHGVEIE